MATIKGTAHPRIPPVTVTIEFDAPDVRRILEAADGASEVLTLLHRASAQTRDGIGSAGLTLAGQIERIVREAAT